MSLIPCTQNCQFQHDGLCTLEQTAQVGSQARPNDLCLNFTPRAASAQRGDGLPDIGHPN
ncbi:MAG TPA: hypothetical protein IAC84_02025 [Firmicutes bacterium]|nr:hypothetical protein [Bacillota bacterium]